MPNHFLIIEARFYEDIADELVKGAIGELEKRGATFERLSVPGTLELPAALSMALRSQAEVIRFDGYVLLGCVIRGETTHFEIVTFESARAILRLATERSLALGFGVLTVDNEAQAWARASVNQGNKGAAAAAVAFDMASMREALGLTHG